MSAPLITNVADGLFVGSARDARRTMEVRTSGGADLPGQALCRKPTGHFGYYGITGNSKALDDFRYRVKRAWRKWLSRRSQTAHVAWDRFALIEARYPLPPARLARPLRVT